MQLAFTCAGCGTALTALGPGRVPFRCPNARPGDDIDHVVRRVDPAADHFPDNGAANPFVRYRHLLSAHALTLERGSTDAAFVALVNELDQAIARVDGHGFVETPFAPYARLGESVGFRGGEIWVKNETGNVSGSHKARHLMGVMLYLAADGGFGPSASPAFAARAAARQAPRPPLAIASCGNAALGAAVVARAADWPLDVFVPTSAHRWVVSRLEQLGARVRTCQRTEGAAGDPCYRAFRAALADGALPFCCQGSDNGLTIEGGETLAWEIVSACRRVAGREPVETCGLDAIFVQVGGGALASAVAQGFARGQALGVVHHLPRIHAVQTSGAYPLKRAYDRVAERVLSRVPLVVEQGFSPAGDHERADLIRAFPTIVAEELRYARTHRSVFMQPWDKEPRSVAHGILDDETYDWAAVVEGMMATGGWPYVVGEDRLAEANVMARELTSIDVDHTGSAGLAGVMKAIGVDPRLETERVAVIFSGRQRG
jgi:threonine synthase